MIAAVPVCNARLAACACLLVGLIAAVPAAAADKLMINTTAREPHFVEDGSGFINLLVDEIFKRLDLEYELFWLPAERSLVFTNDGTADGVVPRAAAIEAGYPNLIRVPGEVFEFDFVAYSKTPDVRIDGWQSLNPYSVGMINGWKIVENNLGSARAISKVSNYRQLLTLLDRGRVEVAILDRVMGSWVLEQLGYDITLLEPPLEIEPTYFYLHRKHQALVPQIARAIADIKSEGVYAEIYQRALGAYARPLAD